MLFFVSGLEDKRTQKIYSATAVKKVSVVKTIKIFNVIALK